MSKNKNSNKKIKKVEEEIEEIEELEEEIDDLEDDESEEVVLKKVKAKKVYDDDDEDDDDDDYKVLSVEDRLERIEQKQIVVIVFSVLSCIIALITMLYVAGNGVATNKTEEPTTSEEEEGASYDTSAFKEISAADIKSESKNQTIVIMIGRQGCGYCAQFAPIITGVGNELGITIRYIDISKMEPSDYEIVRSLTGSGSWKTFAADNFGYTPETLVIKNNKVVGGIVGAADSSSTMTALNDAGIKKK